jgi:hypothetical protein
MAAEFKIGRLRYNWKGTWTAGTTYSRDDVILYRGKAYVCLVPNVANTSFYVDLYASPTSRWQLMIDGKTWLGTWQTSTVYSIGDIVIDGGAAYTCTAAHTSTTFATDAINWSIYTEFAKWNLAWQPNTPYALNDVVRYGGIVYTCLTNHTSAATTALGLEADQSKWSVYFSGIYYSGPWNPSTRYRVNDLVSVNADIYICTSYHTSNAVFDSFKFVIWLPGQDFKLIWSSGTTYQVGDCVFYGGDAYVSKTANNYGNIPSSDATDWQLFNVGFSVRGEWTGGATYPVGAVVTRHGMLYESILDSNGVDPTAYLTPTVVTYTASGSSGTTLKVSSTTALAVGMIVTGTGFGQGQFISSITDGSTVVLDRQPDGTLTNGQNLTFTAVSSTYWKVLVPGQYWTNRWLSSTLYQVGDLAVWVNTTYVCIQSHSASTGNRPDQDTTNTYWTTYVAHARANAINIYGDLETFNNNKSQAIPIGPTTYNLRISGNVPNWQKINVVPAVYYVDINSGTDRLDYGLTWDQPWATINYACTIIGNGQYYANASALLIANKAWMITEMYQWMLYQMANNISPFSTTSLWDPIYTQRDAEAIIDAVVYDIQRGGNSQTVAATLRYFYYGSTNLLINSIVGSSIQYYNPAISFLQVLMGYAIQNTAPSTSYQQLNGISTASSSYVNQVINLALTAEAGAAFQITSLISILTTALNPSNPTTKYVPTSNSGVTAILNIKTGTYNEILPIIVPENVSIVGDELRSVTVQPITSITIYCTQTIASSNRVIVNSTAGLADQMPLQFISPYVNNAPTTFGGVTSGQTYYVIGSSITANSFQLATSPTITFVGTTSLGSNVISNVSNITNIAVGSLISGPGIPAGSSVSAVNQAITGIATVTITNNVTSSQTLQSFTSYGQTLGLGDGTGSMLIYAGDCLKNMWLVRNGTTIRNLSNFGLKGTLTAANTYGTARPTGGSYVSFDPGKGPNDTSVWIFRRSPYIQNVTNFGTGCTGMKVDGTLHSGGTKSMVTNDYTQVLSDGVGVWITGSGAISECVSVFSYYCYIGHFAENGGRIRSTNGNSSYGTYGVVSEGYDSNEVPITGTIFNQSTQVQAQVQDAFGSKDQLLKLNFSNAGSAYFLPATNMLQYSNNFVVSPWATDGNVTFIKNNTAPTGYTEAFLITGTKATAGSGYLYQNISINPAGQAYTSVSGTTIAGPGTGATFNITVTGSGYVVSVVGGGSGYVQTQSIIQVNGSQLGGVTGVNDLIIEVTSVSSGAISTVTTSGTVTIGNTVYTLGGTIPTGSALNYTLSIYVYAGTSQTVDLQGIFSGAGPTLTSGIVYNVSTNACTPYSSGSGTVNTATISAMTPVSYGAQKTLATGWYRVWLTVNDASGINNQLQFRIFPQGGGNPTASSNSGANTFSIFYGSQAELSGSTPAPDFYLETKNSMYTAYANFEIVGAGTGAVMSGDEVRSNSVFNARVIADSNGISGGSGYVTASNNAQGGTTTYIQLAQSDLGTTNYVGMRIFVNSGTGAGQYGYISYYNGTANTVNGIVSKGAMILQESFDSISIIQATYDPSPNNNLLTIAGGTDLSKLYVNQAVQFTPTYYSTTVTSTSTSTVVATAAVGGTTNTIAVSNVAPLYINMPITFSGTTFSTIVTGYTYYITSVDYVNSLIQISNVIYGSAWQLSTATGSMSINYPNAYGYLTAGSTSNMVVNIPVQFTGQALGGVTLSNTYYISDIIDANTFTISNLQVNTTSTTSNAGSASFATTGSSISGNVLTIGTVTSGTVSVGQILSGGPFGSGTNYITGNISGSGNGSTWRINQTFTNTSTNQTITGLGGGTVSVASTSSLVLFNPMVFGGTVFESNLTAGTKYYISSIVDAFTFTVTANLIYLTIVASNATTNLFTCNDTTQLIPGTPIKFNGGMFGGVTADTTYYIGTIANSTQFTISSTTSGIGAPGSDLPLQDGGTTNNTTGYMRARVAPAPLVLAGGSGTMTLSSTTNRTIVPTTSGSMNATFSTSLIGGVATTTIYYITSISGNNITIGTVAHGTPITLSNGVGNMQMGAVGWDNINPGTPAAAALDQTSVYFIEPRTVFTEPAIAQTSTSSTVVGLSAGNQWQYIASGNNIYMALPQYGSSGAISYDGITWTAITLPIAPSSPSQWTGLAYGNGYWIAITSNGTGSGSTVAYSNSNGTGWRTTTMPSVANWSNITYGNGVFVAVASGTTQAAYSTNFGLTWTASQLPGTTLFTATGNAQISTAQFNVGTSSLRLDGTTGTYVSSSTSDYYNYGTGDFTIEAWVRFDAIGSVQAIFDQRSTATDIALLLEISAAGQLRLYVNGSYVITHGTSISATTWAHVAVIRSSGSTKLYLNGTAAATTYTDSNTYYARPLVIGAYFTGATRMTGYVDEFRISTVARQTANFTPSTTAYTQDSNTMALLHFEGANASTAILSSAILGNWVGLQYGSGLFLALGSDGYSAWSYNGAGVWIQTTVSGTAGTTPMGSASLTGVAIAGTGGQFTCAGPNAVLTVGQTVRITGQNTNTGTVTNGTYLISVTNGASTFTLTTLAGGAITTTVGTPIGLVFRVGVPNYTGLAWGNNRFLAIQSGVGLYPAFTFDGITWYQSNTYSSASFITYGQGTFLAMPGTGSGTGYQTDTGVYWKTRAFTIDNYTAVGFGFNTSNIGKFVTLAGRNTGSIISAGAKAQGRVTVTSSVITQVSLWETGSNYTVSPTVSFVDYNVSIIALINARTGVGVLANPTFVNRGSGYNTTSTVVTITGNGYADTYQTGYTLIINNLTSLPLTGSNLTIAGNSIVYKVTSATAVFGTTAPFIEANVQVSPNMSNALSPSSGAAVSVRQLYSQCRLTGHDFLSIGTGNKEATNYPNWDETTAKIRNETIETNQGRVFYTATDENGNFTVGNLFGVQQATGTVTLSATQFGLLGLQTLSLGGIAVGSSSVIVNQFSTDATFVANSDAVIPTQKAIKSYITSRLSQGGANTYTGQLISGSVSVGGAQYIKSTIPNGVAGSSVKIAQKVNFAIVPGSYLYTGNPSFGVDGTLAAYHFFARNAFHRNA